MTTFRNQLDLEAYRVKHPAPAANDENRMPPAWLVVSILIGYIGLIGGVAWALVGVFVR